MSAHSAESVAVVHESVGQDYTFGDWAWEAYADTPHGRLSLRGAGLASEQDARIAAGRGASRLQGLLVGRELHNDGSGAAQ